MSIMVFFYQVGEETNLIGNVTGILNRGRSAGQHDDFKIWRPASVRTEIARRRLVTV